MKKVLQLILLFFATAVVFPLTTSAQSQKEHEKKSYVDSANKYYQQADLPVYLYISTSPDGEKVPLKEASKPKPEPIYLDGHGVHNLRHINAEEKRVENFQIYADGIAPKSTASLTEAPVYRQGAKVFYGKGLSISIKASDELSGIGEVLYSENGGAYLPYTSVIQPQKQGSYTYSYYAVDNVGNVEKVKTTSFMFDTEAPKTYYKIVGITDEKVVSLSTQITFVAEDSISGVAATYYSFDDEAFQPYKGGVIPISGLDNGEHMLTFYSVDNVKNEESHRSLTFFLDRTAPIMSADIMGDRFIVDDKVYFSGRTKMKLTAIDNRSGIKEVKYSINSEPFQTYVEPFYLPNKSGKYLIRYYAVDNVGNNSAEGEATHSSGVVYVDLTGPVIQNLFEGKTFQKGDVTYVSSQTASKLSAVDSESGLKRLAYIVDSGDEQDYTTPFAVQMAGLHKITAVAYDNVNNRNQKEYSIFVDNEGPEIGHSFSTKPTAVESEVEVYPSYVTLFLNAFDEETTISSLAYTINDDKEQQYTSPINGFDKKQSYTVKVKAKDALGNETVKVFIFKTNEL